MDSSAAKHKGPTESQLEAELRILIQAKDVDAVRLYIACVCVCLRLSASASASVPACTYDESAMQTLYGALAVGGLDLPCPRFFHMYNADMCNTLLAMTSCAL